jgi:hypothetical protein
VKTVRRQRSQPPDVIEFFPEDNFTGHLT